MKNIFKFFALAGLMLIAFACVPDMIIHPTEDGIVSASTVQPIIVVDQEINQVTFNIPVGTKGVIPVWQFQDKNGDWTSYSAQDGLKKIYTKAGDYSVRMLLMNASGVSPDYVETTFHIDNTIMNFDKYITFISGATSGSEKEWRIDNSLKGHLGCGPSGSSGLEWWSAGPDEKKDFGVYDNRMTFKSEYSYTFDPGDAGTIYINIDGVTKSEYTKYKEGATADYNVPVKAMTTSYEFDVQGDDLYLVLPANTYWPYFPNDAFIDNPRLKVESMTAKAMELVSDNGEIAWHFSLTSGAAEQEFNGYKYKAESNMWKPIDDASDFVISTMYYAHGNNWEGYPDGSMTFNQEGAKWSINLPYESDQQWQAQFHIQPTSLPLNSATHYDFSCIVNSSTTFGKVTVKLTDNTDDGNFLFAESFEVKAFEDYIFYLTDLAGIDAANTKLVFDFGGCREGTEMIIKNIVLKDHAIDDGTILPGDDPDNPEEEGAHYDVDNPATNFWLNSDLGFTYWYSAGDWSGQLAPEYEWINGDQKDFKLVIPDGIGGSEWMGQTHFTIDHAVSASKNYDFCATINASSDFTCTVKLAWEGNDNDHAFFYVNDFKVKAFEDCKFKMPSIVPDVDYDKVAVFFDFGRTPAGTEITISDVCLQEHQDPKGGGQEVTGNEIWDNSKVTITYWYANSGWGQIANPETSGIAGGWSFIMPAEIGGSEWQGQTHFTMPAAVSPDKKYQFKVTLNSSAECVCTVKLAWEGNDNDHAFFYDNNVQLKAFEDVVYVQYPISPDVAYDKLALFVDLGRTPAGAEVQIKDISLIEVVEPTELWDNSKVTISYWYANSGWGQIANPETSEIAGGWNFIMPAEIGGSEWMGQTHFTLAAGASASKKYDFSICLNSSSDCVCTVKLAWEGNDNDHAFFYENNVQLKAYEDVVFKKSDIAPDVDYDKIALFVDLGRTPGGSEVAITNIHLIEK
jgi:hypothetical protein